MELLRPSDADEAVAALRNGNVAFAGGTELVPLLREGLVHADALVDVRRAVPKGVRQAHGYTWVGAGTTLAELEADVEIPAALREACRLAASPQLRAMGSIGGNLLQATRCWYWRLGFPCHLHGGNRCHAKEGQHGEHAIFGNETCASAHPSDVAAALLALGTTVRTTARELPLAELYRLPTPDDPRTTTLARDELILELRLAAPDASAYVKAMDRQRWSFPVVGVAAARRGDEVTLALAGVAPIPWTLHEVSELEAATPLPGTAYKLPIARALVRRAVAALGAR